MKLGQLFDPSDLSAPIAADPDITGITADSRAVKPGFLFAALKGSTVDGVTFVRKAVEAGAVAVLAAEDAAIDADVTVIRSADTRRSLALAAARFSEAQSEKIVAVTGTAGKTSVADFTRQIFAFSGLKSASVGTLGVVTSEGDHYGSLTTPDPVSLHQSLAKLASGGITHVAMEASSHGIDQRRLDGVEICAAGFTNLGRDHLDYHGTMEAYLEAKLRLFDTLLPADGVAVFDADVPEAARIEEIAAARGIRMLSVGWAGTDLKVTDVKPEGFRQSVTLETAHGTRTVALPLAGTFQISNALVAAGLANSAGVDMDDALAALETLKGAKGRLEYAGETPSGGLVFIDYAHKPDALEAALTALRPFAKRHLVALFGAGGDRDPGKRPIMGDVGGRLADTVIVTDDNPRSEDPALVRAAILVAVPSAAEIGDRAAAIREGVRMLEEGDVLLVAGKGHETGQIVGDVVSPFSDHEEVAKAIKDLEG